MAKNVIEVNEEALGRGNALHVGGWTLVTSRGGVTNVGGVCSYTNITKKTVHEGWKLCEDPRIIEANRVYAETVAPVLVEYGQKRDIVDEIEGA